jgi:hypothetical protein
MLNLGKAIMSANFMHELYNGKNACEDAASATDFSNLDIEIPQNITPFPRYHINDDGCGVCGTLVFYGDDATTTYTKTVPALVFVLKNNNNCYTTGVKGGIYCRAIFDSIADKVCKSLGGVKQQEWVEGDVHIITYKIN